MANYTMTLKSLVETGYQIFDDSWNTFDPSHKAELISKILQHYWFYEIGSETADRFKWNINEHLALIMPYYNKLFESELLKIEPLYNYCLETIGDTSRKKGRNRGVGERRDVNSIRQMAESIKRLSEGTSNLVGNEKMVGKEKWTEDRTIDKKEVTDQDTTQNTNQNTTKDTTGKEVFSETVDTTTNEVMGDTVDGTKDVTGTSTTTTSNTRRYSDTPQGQVVQTGLAIDSMYLTNYTQENGSSNTNTTSKETIHNQEDKKTDTTSKKKTSSTKEITENVTGTNKENVTGTNDVTVTTNTTDKVVGNRDKEQNTDETENVKTTSTEHDFSNGSQSDRTATTGYVDEKETEDENEKRTNVAKGFTIAQAELLQRYRDTFLNIDRMIIRDLATDFMGIF